MDESCCIGDGTTAENITAVDVNPESSEQLAALFKALADKRRLVIMGLVAGKDDVCACELLDELEISPSTLSHHTRILVNAGLLTCCRKGKWAHYGINESGIKAVLTAMGWFSDALETPTNA